MVFQDDPDDRPRRFVVQVPRNGMDRDQPWNERPPLVQSAPEIAWLNATETAYSLHWTDWCIYGWHPIVTIEDAGRAALFKLMFA